MMEEAETYAILIAIGNRSRALLWAIHAENCGYACQVASSAAEAIDLFTNYPFRLLIVGDDFSDGRGRQMVAAARALTPKPRIFGVLGGDSPKFEKAFEPGSVDESIQLSCPMEHLELLWKIWIPPNKPSV
jgi:hypothetical protein